MRVQCDIEWPIHARLAARLAATATGDNQTGPNRSARSVSYRHDGASLWSGVDTSIHTNRGSNLCPDCWYITATPVATLVSCCASKSGTESIRRTSISKPLSVPLHCSLRSALVFFFFTAPFCNLVSISLSLITPPRYRPPHSLFL